jgi:hypothetical protein
MMRSPRRTALRFWTFVALAAPALVGCGATGNVSGKVSYKDKPLNSGTVTFMAANNTVLSSPIAEDGSYSIAKCPAGEVKITVATPPAAPPMAQGRMKMDPSKMGAPPGASEAPKSATPVTVPPDYKDPEKSKLSYTVQKGDQTHNIDLK